MLLLLLARLALALLGGPITEAWFQSPVSPLTPTPLTPTPPPPTPTEAVSSPTPAETLPSPTAPPSSATATLDSATSTPSVTATAPTLTPTTSIILPGLSSGGSPLQPPVPQPEHSPLAIPPSPSPLSDPGIWSSPLPWAAIGVLFFGGMAWLVIAIARQMGSDGSP